MTQVEQSVTPMRFVLAVLGTLVLGFAVSATLWSWWSDRCGDNCPSPSVVHMLVFLGLLPTAAAASAVLLLSVRWPRRTKMLVGGAIALLALVLGVLVSRIPGA